MRFRQSLRLLLLLLIVVELGWVLALVLVNRRQEPPSHQEPERPLEAPARGPMQEDQRGVTLAADTQEKSGLVVAPLAPISYQEEVNAYGTVLPLQDLIDVWSNYAAAKAQVVKTQASLGASRKEYDRLKSLHTTNQNISEKALQAAEATWRADEASARAAQDALQAVERTARQRWGSVLVEWLSDTSSALDRLMQQRDVLIQLTVPVGVHLGSAPPTARVQAGDGTVVSATLVSPAPQTDPRLQGLSFFYLAPAQIPGLLAGMNILASLPVGSPVPGVVVPASAVVRWQGKAWVYVQKETHRFVRREIATNTPLKEDWFVADGLAAGDQIIVGGAQLLLSEEFRTQIQVSEGGGSS
jgi:hypothetical protein